MTALITPTQAAALGDRVPRDRWGRPLIKPVGGATKATPYTRVSTLAKTLDDTTALTDWKCRQVAVGLDRRPDLRALVSADHGDRKQLNTVIKAALDAAGSDVAANVGTAIHSFAEAVDNGGHIDQVPPDYRAHVEAYRATLTAAGIMVVACERFVVHDELQAAGTYDRLLLLPDGRFVIGDIKTGVSAPNYALATAMQVAVYARSQHYDPDTFTRTPLPNVDTSIGVLIHLPQDEPKCELHALDLVTGWDAAFLATDIRAKRKLTLAHPWATQTTPINGGGNPTQPNKGDNK